MWQVFTMKFDWHVVHCSGSFVQMEWNIQRNNRLANFNMDFFDGIVNKSENCVKKKLLLMSLFYFMSLIISVASWLIVEFLSIFETFFVSFHYFQHAKHCSVAYTIRSIGKNYFLGCRLEKKDKPMHWISLILFFFCAEFLIVLINSIDFFPVCTLINSTLLNFLFISLYIVPDGMNEIQTKNHAV